MGVVGIVLDAQKSTFRIKIKKFLYMINKISEMLSSLKKVFTQIFHFKNDTSAWGYNFTVTSWYYFIEFYLSYQTFLTT